MTWWHWLLLCLAAFASGALGVWVAEMLSRRGMASLEGDLAKAIKDLDKAQKASREREGRLAAALRDKIAAEDKVHKAEAGQDGDSLAGAWDDSRRSDS